MAYDTFFAVTRDLSPFKRWTLRCHVMLLIGAHLVARVTYLCFKPGMMRIIFLPYLSFFRPGFHPWNHDDSALIREFERRLGLTRPAPAKD